MNLGDIITTLEAADPNQVIRHGFHNPHSYRGDYYDLAFEPAENITVADMLEAARSAVGATYEGWKGGDFRMTDGSWCWLSEEGSASGETISPLLLKFMLTPPVDQTAALQQDVARLGRMVDEYGTGASALTDKLKRVRDLHRETCILARGDVQPTAFTCGMCDVLDAPAAPTAVEPPADQTAELERLRTENGRMRHELEVMYGGAFDSPKPAPADRAALRDRIAEALRPWVLDSGHGAEERAAADAVLPVLPPPVSRADVLREAAERLERKFEGASRVTIELRRMADEAQPAEALDDGEGDELVCVDMCGSCDACGMEPFGTPAEGWREAARFLRRTARTSGNRQGALHGAQLIEAELRRRSDEAQQDGAQR